MQAATLGWGQHAGTGAVVALVGQRGQAQQGSCGMQSAEEAGGSGVSQVMGRAGLHIGDCDLMPVGVADDLYVAAVLSVFAGILHVMAVVGVLRSAALVADEGAVDGDVGPAGGL